MLSGTICSLCVGSLTLLKRSCVRLCAESPPLLDCETTRLKRYRTIATAETRDDNRGPRFFWRMTRSGV